MKLKTFTPLLLALGVTLNGCATSKDQPNRADAELDASNGVAPEVNPDEIDDTLDQELQSSVNGKVPEIGSEEDEINSALKAGIPVEINADVNRWIEFFAVKNKDAYQRFLDRGHPHKNMIVATLRDAGIPSEIYYLAMIESGFVINAHSSASAVGFWQFIPGTGRRYGLRVDGFVDERRDPLRSTVAASLYLADLHNVFNSWYLAMAAYNAGEMRIMNAIMRGKSRDFWDLVRQRVLPQETMNYIPKFLAAYIIGKDPAKYGFRVPNAESNEPFVGVNVPSPIRLSSVSEQTNIPLENLQTMNPHLKTGVTPADTNTYKIWIPRRFENNFRDNASNLAEHRLPVKAQIAAAKAVNGAIRKFHRVRRGETLTAIAQKYGLSVDQLKSINNPKSNTVYRGTKLKVLQEETATKVASNNAKARNNASDGVYRVRRGDKLHVIAKKFGMSVAELKKMNNLRRNMIKVGQVLKVNGSNAG